MKQRYIYGVGVDICKVERIKNLVNRSDYHLKRFVTGTFHENEQTEFWAKDDTR